MQAEDKIDIHKWLINAGLGGAGEQDLVNGFSECLVDAGVPLRRFFVGSNILHPVHEGRGIAWTQQSGLDVEFYEPLEEDEADPEDWVKSPFYSLMNGNSDRLHRQLDDTYRIGEFPILDRFQAEGASGYLAIKVGFGDQGSLGGHRGLLCSFCVDGANGVDERLQDSLYELSHSFALAYKSMMEVFTGRTLMRTYLGGNAASRVLSGAIRRGRAETVESVLWYSDLKGFTRVADTAPREHLMPFLNGYAECVVEAVDGNGGEVLKFMGDGVLAMFPAENAAEACGAALDAAAQAITRFAELNKQREADGLPASDFHLGLHRGGVLYGNIGSRERLDFTVIGPAVNELARIENMCRILDQRVVVSSAFAQTPGLSRDRLVSLGRYALRGVSRPQELFTIDPENLSINSDQIQ